ncbi:MAG: DNA polymerase III subunit chi [Pseudomonadota bacterium]
MQSPRVDFYLLESSNGRAKDMLACRLATKAFASDMKVYIRVSETSDAQRMDELLWTFKQNSFLPHAIAHADNNADQYPIQIGTDTEPPAGCDDFLIQMSGHNNSAASQFNRIAELVGPGDAEKQAGRERFRYYRQHGIEPDTHQVTL